MQVNDIVAQHTVLIFVSNRLIDTRVNLFLAIWLNNVDSIKITYMLIIGFMQQLKLWRS